jgi:outer membrane protein OmpA-like peptidoglycan-associated protein
VRSQLAGKNIHALFLSLLLLPGVSGCVATQRWVQEQMTPLQEQVAQVDRRLSQTEVKADQTTGQIAELGTHVGQIDTKAALALKNLQNLRLERHVVLGVKESANFAFDSASLTPTTQRAIDAFFDSLNGASDVIFLVTGHTDNTGPETYNYVLGQKRANSVARYLMTQKGVNPLRVSVVSYGEKNPLADNATLQGRHQNRRVEILVYKETVTSAPGPQRLELMHTSQK